MFNGGTYFSDTVSRTVDHTCLVSLRDKRERKKATAPNCWFVCSLIPMLFAFFCSPFPSPKKSEINPPVPGAWVGATTTFHMSLPETPMSPISAIIMIYLRSEERHFKKDACLGIGD
ncbi:hypothetical protein F4820DRAFT_385613 [Hypoxylon rubiginosum]|uniref:Uncharacterized protein n=1 Tax=Hypoxylon rubiginosum TaxID=110542 RepID=A0ACB9ZEI9_9PEZI|nr:hypothetical protein F4820DRAFT_385613 [Hypoxylon rubiginosum]